MKFASLKRSVLLLCCGLIVPLYGAGAEDTKPETFVPGLGEFMTGIQLRHAKLWFAGKTGNWALAAYELDEIKEGFGDAAQFQPDFKGIAVAKMIQEKTASPIESLEKVIDGKDKKQFATAFDNLTAACNACHQSVGFGFISIQRPTVAPVSNQKF